MAWTDYDYLNEAYDKIRTPLSQRARELENENYENPREKTDSPPRQENGRPQDEEDYAYYPMFVKELLDFEDGIYKAGGDRLSEQERINQARVLLEVLKKLSEESLPHQQRMIFECCLEIAIMSEERNIDPSCPPSP